MESIIQKEKEKCFLCGCRASETHHVFGSSNRKNSTKYGLIVYLCHNCHNEPPIGVHHNKETMQKLHITAQKKFMEYYNKSINEFRNIFHKSYI